MQIKAIVLYNRDGSTRILPFRLGSVNIVTGQSSRGKSALVEIVEYCLGRSDFKVPEGVIRDTVSWYGVVFQIRDSQVLVAKPAPQGNSSSQSQAYIEIATEIAIPVIDQLVPNTNDDGIVAQLSSLIGIGPNRHTPDFDESRQPLSATLKQSTFYLFQKQSTIANQDILFHRQQEPFIPQAIKDTLPYFLGAVREDKLALEGELRREKRELRLLQRQIQEIKQVAGDRIVRGQSLIAEAQQVGLIVETVNSNNSQWDQIRNVLQRTLQWVPSNPSALPNDELLDYQDRLEELRGQIQQLEDAIRASENFARRSQGYTAEAVQQELRLQSIGLFDDALDLATCPLCSSPLSDAVPQVQAIKESLARIGRNVQVVDRKQPRLQEQIDALYTKRNELRSEVVQLEETIATLVTEQEEARRFRDSNTRIARVVGRISLYLESVHMMDDSMAIREKLESARLRVHNLETLLESEEEQERLASILSLLSHQMTKWADELRMEHSGLPHRLDLKRLTVVADRPGRPIPMDRMGSGANWLGCHLIALLSLHRYFSEQKRPVPNFIFLDQPTQVFFPKLTDYQSMRGESQKELENANADLNAVQRMFGLLFSLCEELAPELQIIVLEHATLDDSRFQDALVEEPWFGRRGLIPDDWIEVQARLGATNASS